MSEGKEWDGMNPSSRPLVTEVGNVQSHRKRIVSFC